jgi:hypothetical protein
MMLLKISLQKNLRLLKYIFVFLFALSYTPSFSQTNVAAEGFCKTIRLGDSHKSERCDLIYSYLENGRVLFQFVFMKTVVAFSGQEDSQMNTLEYKLKVDALTVGFAPNGLRRYQAIGGCMIRLKDMKGDFISYVRCKASNGIEEAEIFFEGGKKPVKKM